MERTGESPEHINVTHRRTNIPDLEEIWEIRVLGIEESYEGDVTNRGSIKVILDEREVVIPMDEPLPFLRLLLLVECFGNDIITIRTRPGLAR